jgi:hypothetical protein
MYVVWVSHSPDHWPSSTVRLGAAITRRHQPTLRAAPANFLQPFRARR